MLKHHGKDWGNPSDPIVILVTKSELKDIKAPDIKIERETLTIEPSIEDVESKLKSLKN